MKSKCRYYETCSAPLCPLDQQSLDHGAWFPDEEICRVQPGPAFVKRQKALARKLDFEAGCFTVRMLERRCKATQSLSGLDPDKGPPHDHEEKWLADHPKYVASQAQKENSKRQLEALKKQGFAGENQG